jgi:hypothetical protein
MSEAIDRFCNGLNQELTAIEDRLSSVRDALRSAPAEAAETLQVKPEQARQKLESKQEEVQCFREKTAQWLKSRKAEARATIDEWVATREKERLEARATRAAEYAAAAAVLAAAAIDEAEVVTLEAVQARLLAESASDGEKPLRALPRRRKTCLRLQVSPQLRPQAAGPLLLSRHQLAVTLNGAKRLDQFSLSDKDTWGAWRATVCKMLPPSRRPVSAFPSRRRRPRSGSCWSSFSNPLS